MPVALTAGLSSRVGISERPEMLLGHRAASMGFICNMQYRSSGLGYGLQGHLSPADGSAARAMPSSTHLLPIPGRTAFVKDTGAFGPIIRLFKTKYKYYQVLFL